MFHVKHLASVLGDALHRLGPVLVRTAGFGHTNSVNSIQKTVLAMANTYICTLVLQHSPVGKLAEKAARKRHPLIPTPALRRRGPSARVSGEAATPAAGGYSGYRTTHH